VSTPAGPSLSGAASGSRLLPPRRAVVRAAGPRRDVQGLRAFAVVAVVLDHLLDWPPGGFVGVDVFFVISGFLITGILLREHERTGRISFRSFYIRRVKRILPAAVLVLAATLVASYFLLNAARRSATVVDGLYALVFSANWRFALDSTDYFAQGRPVSPVQQYWSLAVEEQFYVVWPCLLLLVLTLVTRGRRSHGQARVVLGVVLASLTLLSFAWSMWETGNVPTRAYFSTLSRTWELGVGALLAVGARSLGRLPALVRPVLAWTGLAGMTASLFLVTSDVAFPAPWALLPVLSTALVIAAGTGIAQQRALAPLTNQASQYVGDISYSLYLWHFPVIVLGTTVLGRHWFVLGGLAVGMLALSICSYHLVEDPIRRSNWLESSSRTGHASGTVDSSKRRRLGWISLGVVVFLLLWVAVLVRFGPDRAPVPGAGQPPGAGETDGPSSTALQQDLSQVLQASSWPETDPPMDEAVGGPQAPGDVLSCGTTPRVDLEACSWGPTGGKTAVVVGDSIAMTYVTTVREALPDWRVVSLGGFGCTFTEPLIANDVASLEDNCQARKQAAVEAINELQPDLVFVSNVQYPRVPKGTDEPLTEQEWATSTLELVDKFAPAAGRVVFLAPPPADKDINECYTQVSSPADCVGVVTEEWQARAAAERGMAESVGGVWLDSAAWFCVDGQCPAVSGTTPVKVDGQHMTAEYAAKIAPAFKESLTARGLL
jgi:peptidoglycan/LPS O-acetylase OafA/YrhL